MRLKYIDALRGFTMFLVVFGHVLSHGLGLEFDDSIVADILSRFRMPMFFFISGYIGFKSLDKFNTTYFKRILKHKSFVQLVPTFIVFSVYMFSIGNTPISFFKHGLQGYWFTLVLFEFFVFFYLTSYVLNHIKLARLQDVIYLSLVPLSFIFSLAFGHSVSSGVDIPAVFNVLSVTNCCFYFPYFILGLLVRKYDRFILHYMTDKFTITMAFAVFVICFLLKKNYFTVTAFPIVYHILNSVVLRITGLIFVFNVFYHSSDYFNKEGRISRVMQFVGRRTLDIYLLHYFFIPDLSSYRDYFFVGGREFIIGEIVIIGFAITIPIIAICLLLSKCIRTSPILEKYIFGVISK